MSAHFVIKIVAFFCVLSDVLGQELEPFVYSIYPDFVNLTTTSERAFHVFSELDLNGDFVVRLDDLRAWFNYLDRNDDQRIVPAEYGSVFNSGVPLWALGLFAYFDARDGDTSGIIRHSDLAVGFDVADLNGDDQIEREELRRSFNMVVRAIFEQSCPLVFRAAPYNYNFNF